MLLSSARSSPASVGAALATFWRRWATDDWDQATTAMVAGFRQSVGSDVEDPGFVQLVGELSLSSERFRRLWARHDVLSFEGAPVRLDHPQVGELTLSREKLAIGGAQGQLLVIYHAQLRTSSAEKLALLASLANSTASVTSANESRGGHDRAGPR